MNIVVSINPAFLNPLKTMLKSLLRFHGVDLYMLEAEPLEEKDYDAIRQLIRPGRLCIVPIPDKLDIPTDFSPSSLSRIFAPFLLPQLDRVLYLDSDILVRGDLSGLYDMDLQGKSIAAVADPGIPQVILEALDLKLGEYINSGVILMDCDKIRRSHTYAGLLQSLRSYQIRSRYVDQDFINELFRDDICYAPEVYNCFSGWKTLAVPARIVHYITSMKPWSAHYDRRFFVAYRRIWNSVAEQPMPFSTVPRWMWAAVKSISRKALHRLRLR